jgi:hypothetical protein
VVLALCHQPCVRVAAVNSLLSCRDLTRCTDVANCTRHDAMLRAGYLCHDFPYFNGWGTSRSSPTSVSGCVRGSQSAAAARGARRGLAAEHTRTVIMAVALGHRGLVVIRRAPPDTLTQASMCCQCQ